MQIFLKSAEVKLVETLGAIHEPAGWYAVHFHLGQLMEQYKSEYQFNIAINLIHDLLKGYDGGIFLLEDHSIIMLCFGLERAVHNKIIFQLRYLYMDDPLSYTEEGKENPDFCTSYDLRRDWQEFWNVASRRMAVNARKVPGAPVPRNQPVIEGEKPRIPPRAEKTTKFSISNLANVERDFQYADLAKVIRRQAICAALPNTPIRHVLDELYINIAHLRQILKTDVDFLSNRWLFKYFTQALDERMINFISNNPRYLENPVSINLNVETLLSPVFAEFDANLKPEAKVAMVLEVPAIDIFANMEVFMVAKRQVQRQGYRVCIDGLTAMSFTQVNREKLGIDLLKLQWNSDSKNDLNTLENRELASAVVACGTNRVILCRCDNLSAIQYGQAMGISLFQGRYIDSIVNPEAKVEN